MPADIWIHPGTSEVGTAVADRVSHHLAVAAERGERCVLGWPAGRTPLPVLDALAERARDGRLDLSHAAFAMMDEYVLDTGSGWRAVSPEAHYSCLGFARREIADRLNAALPDGKRLPADAVWAADPADPQGYEERLAEGAGVAFFLVALGAGDGHVAFNPPGTTLDSRTRVVALAETTRRDNLATFPGFRDLDEVPAHGISVGLGTILSAGELAVVAHGEGKREAVRRTLSGPRAFSPDWPAGFVHTHPRHAFHLDRAAAGDPAPESACAAS